MPEIDLDKVKVESKFHEKMRKLGDWCRVHKDELIVGGTVFTSLAGVAVKWNRGRQKLKQVEQEQFNKDRYVYDRSLGMYLKLKRPLGNNDYVLINQRKQQGEKLSNILASMNLLE